MHWLRRTTTLRSCCWAEAALLGARVYRVAAKRPLAGEALAGADTAEPDSTCASGARGVESDGVDPTRGVTTGRTLTGATVTGGVLPAGTVTVTGDTAGVVTGGLLAVGTVTAPLGSDFTANIANNATVSRAPTRIGRRTTASNERTTVATRCFLVLPLRTLRAISVSPHRASLRRCRRPPT
jgi:hypothetical protein